MRMVAGWEPHRMASENSSYRGLTVDNDGLAAGTAEGYNLSQLLVLDFDRDGTRALLVSRWRGPLLSGVATPARTGRRRARMRVVH